MSLTHMPKLKFFFKRCVILTSTKISASQRPWPFVTLKENKRNCSPATGQVLCSVSVAQPKRLSQLRCGASRRLGPEHYQSHTAEKHALGTGCSSSPPALSLASPRTALPEARRQGHRQPPSAGRRGWRGSVPRFLLTDPTPGVQMEVSQGRQSYSLIWEGGGLGKTRLPPTPPHLTYLRVKH